MSDYFRPIPQTDPARPRGAPRIAGGPCWFDRVEHLRRDRPPRVVPLSALPSEQYDRLTMPRAPLVGLPLDRPRIMGIVNVTPDSFSDGGTAFGTDVAVARALALAEGSDLLDIGGESTRPGAADVSATEEAGRIVPVIAALARRPGLPPISVDTRKAAVAREALGAGAAMVNDVTAFAHDPGMAALVADAQVPVCLMHSPPPEAGMHFTGGYTDVLLDVYDALAAAVAAAGAAGIPPSRVIVDPGIGFGKTAAHNLALLARVSLFHGLGCAVLVGASRKRFIGAVGAAPDAMDRLPGSLAVALAAVGQGVQIVRVHDAAQTRQALRLDRAARGGRMPVGAAPEPAGPEGERE